MYQTIFLKTLFANTLESSVGLYQTPWWWQQKLLLCLKLLPSKSCLSWVWFPSWSECGIGSRYPATSWMSAHLLPHLLAVGWECILARWHVSMYRVVFYPQEKKYTLILPQGCPVEYAFYSLLLSYMGSYVLVSESLKSCLLVLCFRLY